MMAEERFGYHHSSTRCADARYRQGPLGRDRRSASRGEWRRLCCRSRRDPRNRSPNRGSLDENLDSLAHLVAAADALSGARPAPVEKPEAYTQRVDDIEAICAKFSERGFSVRM